MRHYSLATLITLLTASLQLSAQKTNLFALRNYTANVAFVTMDSSSTDETTVVEYPNFLVLVELPFSHEGADKSSGFAEDTIQAKAFLQFLHQKYPQKPVKYVLSSHWHLHSLSAITPFFKEGGYLVTTKNNWTYTVNAGLIGNEKASTYAKRLIEINKDTALLSGTAAPIQVIYLDSTYTNKPTKDYLFFYFPKLKTLHASCMCVLQEIDLPNKKNLVYSNRLIDLKRVIVSHNLPVDTLIKLGRNPTKINKDPLPVFPISYLHAYMRKGKSLTEATQVYTQMETSLLVQKKDSIIEDAIQNRISPEIINQAVYASIKNKSYIKAVILAQILNLYYPGQVNYIDTMGEAYFVSGDTTTASFYSDLLKSLDANFSGGLPSWKQNQVNNTY